MNHRIPRPCRAAVGGARHQGLRELRGEALPLHCLCIVFVAEYDIACLCIVVPQSSLLRHTVPLYCVGIVLVVVALLLPSVRTAFVALPVFALCLHCLRGQDTAFAASCLHRLRNQDTGCLCSHCLRGQDTAFALRASRTSPPTAAALRSCQAAAACHVLAFYDPPASDETQQYFLHPTNTHTHIRA